MQTQIVKTTMYFPEELHTLLREEAYYEKKSINRLVIEKLTKEKPKKIFKVSPLKMNVTGSMDREKVYDEVLDKHAN